MFQSNDTSYQLSISRSQVNPWVQARSIPLALYGHIHVCQLTYRYLDSRCRDALIYYQQHYTARFPVVGYLSSIVVDVMGYKAR